MNTGKIIFHCVSCQEKAITVAFLPFGNVPVCEKHYQEYEEEGRKYLPWDERLVANRLYINGFKLGVIK